MSEVELEGVKLVLQPLPVEVESELLDPELQALQLKEELQKTLFSASNRRPTSVKEAHERRTARRFRADESTS